MGDGNTVRGPPDERFDVVGQGGPEQSKVDAAEEEPEEYYKELEERLYPLDEVKLKRQMKKNTERLKTMTLGEMSMLLKIPVETLTENREASPCELSTPEYWLAWYKKTLAAVEEAIRANRDFQKDRSEKVVPAGPVSPVVFNDRDVGGRIDTVTDELLQAVRPVPVCALEAVDVNALWANFGVDLETYVSVKSEDAEKYHEKAWLSVKVADLRLHMLPSRYRSLDARTWIEVSAVSSEKETFPERSLFNETEDDLYQYVYTVREYGDVSQKRRPVLYEVPESDVESDSNDDLVSDGKRVIGSVNGVEAVSAGSLNGITGHKIGAKGVIDLPLRLGSLEMDRPFVVVHRLHVDAILGTDTLKAFRAVIDLDDNTLTLKTTNEVFKLGSPRVEESHLSRISLMVRLRPGGQAIVVTDVIGNLPEGATVLVEESPELDATVLVTRTLCTVQSGRLLVEVCTASTEDVLLKKGTTVAVASLVPDSAFGFEKGTEVPSDADSHPTNKGCPASDWVDSVLSATTNDCSPQCPSCRRCRRRSWKSTLRGLN
ncbi:putative membrane protein [Phytophthora megakarya]|uniref:Putative membrane protein n=1 Tax=Phytophthora megakarya TaxID=4795 RepID=A0A225W9M9_9STRA|nr:putative membrane protein [Phytophthora megakarya]